MDVNTVVTLDGKDYLLTQKTQYNGYNYYMAGRIEGNKMLNTYGVFKETNVNGKTILSSVDEENELTAVYALLTRDLLEETEKLENRIAIGSFVDLDGKEYIVLDYIPYEENQYMILVTSTKPIDVLVSKLIKKPDNTLDYEDVSELPVAKEVLKAFSVLHAND